MTVYANGIFGVISGLMGHRQFTAMASCGDIPVNMYSTEAGMLT